MSASQTEKYNVIIRKYVENAYVCKSNMRPLTKDSADKKAAKMDANAAPDFHRAYFIRVERA